MQLTRRQVLTVSGATALTALAGCAQEVDENPEANETDGESGPDGFEGYHSSHNEQFEADVISYTVGGIGCPVMATVAVTNISDSGIEDIEVKVFTYDKNGNLIGDGTEHIERLASGSEETVELKFDQEDMCGDPGPKYYKVAVHDW